MLQESSASTGKPENQVLLGGLEFMAHEAYVGWKAKQVYLGSMAQLDFQVLMVNQDIMVTC